jgi:membrane associated rhomboid family serine protease
MFNRITPAVKNLIIINVLMLLATMGLSNYIKLDEYLALYYYQSPYFHYYQYITYMFMHGGFLHILLNMWGLYMFGSILEQVWGSKRFLIFYFVTGIGAALFYTLVNHFEFAPMIKAQHAFINTPTPSLLQLFVKEYLQSPSSELLAFINQWAQAPGNSQMILKSKEIVNTIASLRINAQCEGASGAIYGILLGFAMLFPNTKIMMLFLPIPIKAKYFVIFFGALELYSSISQAGDNIAHVAHLGGMIFGFIMIKLWSTDRNRFY